MKIINPKYKEADAARIEKYAAIMDAYIASLPSDIMYVDYEKIKADILAMNLPGVTAADITDEKIEKLAKARNILSVP